MYHFLRVLVLLSIVKSSFCQDQTNFTQFFLNPFLINPSYAGIDGKTTLSVHYRNQWTSIEGAPRIGNFSLHTPLNPKLSFGTSVTNDSRGVFNTSGLQLTIAYNIAISDDAFIRFGISGGGAWNMVDLKKLDGFNDPALANILDNNASITGNAGLSFHAKTFHFGASLPTLLSPSLVSTDAFTVTEVKPFEAILVHASNRFYFNKNKNVFEPYAIYRMNTGLPSQFEVAGILHLNHAIWLGSSYKQDFGISALGGVKLKNMFAIGASYGLQNAGINELNSPTVEITLGYLLGKHKKDTPLYSFINTVKEKKKVHHHQSASEAIAQKHKEDELARKKHQEELAKQRQQELAEQKRQQEELARKQREEALARKNERNNRHWPHNRRQNSPATLKKKHLPVRLYAPIQ
jgi:type IX secretion system PorP/SprF family membrane protein